VFSVKPHTPRPHPVKLSSGVTYCILAARFRCLNFLPTLVRSISVDPGISHIYDESLTPLLGQVQSCLVVVRASGPHPQLFTTTCIGKPIAGLHKAAIGDLRSGDNGLTSKALDESLDHFAAKLSPPRLKTQTVSNAFPWWTSFVPRRGRFLQATAVSLHTNRLSIQKRT
jgi:hypothetical protein